MFACIIYATDLEPQHRHQESLLPEAILPTAAQNRKLLLSQQGLAAHGHAL